MSEKKSTLKKKKKKSLKIPIDELDDEQPISQKKIKKKTSVVSEDGLSLVKESKVPKSKKGSISSASKDGLVLSTGKGKKPRKSILKNEDDGLVVTAKAGKKSTLKKQAKKKPSINSFQFPPGRQESDGLVVSEAGEKKAESKKVGRLTTRDLMEQDSQLFADDDAHLDEDEIRNGSVPSFPTYPSVDIDEPRAGSRGGSLKKKKKKARPLIAEEEEVDASPSLKTVKFKPGKLPRARDSAQLETEDEVLDNIDQLEKVFRGLKLKLDTLDSLDEEETASKKNIKKKMRVTQGQIKEEREKLELLRRRDPVEEEKARLKLSILKEYSRKKVQFEDSDAPKEDLERLEQSLKEHLKMLEHGRFEELHQIYSTRKSLPQGARAQAHIHRGPHSPVPATVYRRQRRQSQHTNRGKNYPVGPEVFEAAKSGKLSEVKRLLEEEEMSVNTVEPKFSSTALHAAVRARLQDVVEYLIYKGIDLDYRDYHGQTALHIAIIQRFDEMAELLLDAGAEHSVEDNHGKTPIYYSVRYAHFHGELKQKIAEIERMRAAVDDDVGEEQIEVYLGKTKKFFKIVLKETDEAKTLLSYIAERLGMLTELRYFELLDIVLTLETPFKSDERVLARLDRWPYDRSRTKDNKLVFRTFRGTPRDIVFAFRRKVMALPDD